MYQFTAKEKELLPETYGDTMIIKETLVRWILLFFLNIFERAEMNYICEKS